VRSRKNRQSGYRTCLPPAENVPPFREGAGVIAELRYLGGYVLLILGVFVAIALAALFASLYGAPNPIAVTVLSFVIGGCALVGYGVFRALRPAKATSVERPAARFAPIAVLALICISNFFTAFGQMQEPRAGLPTSTGRLALTLLTALGFGIAAVPGLWTRIRVRLDRFAVSEKRPAPSTPEGRRRGRSLMALLLAAGIAFVFVKPAVGFVWAFLDVSAALMTAMLLIERYANLRLRRAPSGDTESGTLSPGHPNPRPHSSPTGFRRDRL
jgi:hypothetical protein